MVRRCFIRDPGSAKRFPDGRSVRKIRVDAGVNANSAKLEDGHLSGDRAREVGRKAHDAKEEAARRWRFKQMPEAFGDDPSNKIRRQHG